MSASRRTQLLMSILGRSLMVILITILGMFGGLAVGGYRALVAVNALPPSPATMGFASAGFAPIIIVAVHLAVGAAGGALVGLFTGLLGAVLWPHRPDPGK